MCDPRVICQWTRRAMMLLLNNMKSERLYPGSWYLHVSRVKNCCCNGLKLGFLLAWLLLSSLIDFLGSCLPVCCRYLLVSLLIYRMYIMNRASCTVSCLISVVPPTSHRCPWLGKHGILSGTFLLWQFHNGFAVSVQSIWTQNNYPAQKNENSK